MFLQNCGCRNGINEMIGMHFFFRRDSGNFSQSIQRNCGYNDEIDEIVGMRYCYCSCSFDLGFQIDQSRPAWRFPLFDIFHLARTGVFGLIQANFNAFEERLIELGFPAGLGDLPVGEQESICEKFLIPRTR